MTDITEIILRIAFCILAPLIGIQIIGTIATGSPLWPLTGWHIFIWVGGVIVVFFGMIFHD